MHSIVFKISFACEILKPKVWFCCLFSTFVWYTKSNIYLTFTCKAFHCFFHICIKICFCKSIKFRSGNKTFGIRYFIFNLCGFCIQSRLCCQVSNAIYLLSTSTAFAFRAAFVARLVMSAILFSISVAFIFSMVVATNPVKLDILFSVSVFVLLMSVFLTSSPVLGIFFVNIFNLLKTLFV